VYIGDTLNTKMTIGLTINQADNDNEILAFKSSDVTHGFTSKAEADSFGTFAKRGAADGGVTLFGYTAAAIGLGLYGRVTSEATIKASNRSGAINIVGQLLDGTTTGAMSANANIVAVKNHNITVWILDADGDTWQSGIATMPSLMLGTTPLSESDLGELTEAGETALHSHAGGGGGGAAADVTVDDAALDKFLGPFDEETDDLQDLIEMVDEQAVEVIQSDAEPGTTYPGMIWMDTDAQQTPGVGGNWVLVDSLSQTDSGVLDWDITGLHGNSDEKYKIDVRYFEDTSSGSNQMKLQLNLDTGANYQYESHWFGGSHSHISDSSEANIPINLCNSNANSWGEGIVYARSGFPRYAIFDAYRSQASGYNVVGTWNNTADEVTSITLFSDDTCKCEIKIYRWQETRASDIAISGWQLVESKSHDSGALDWTISGLAGDTDKKYKLDVLFYEDLGSASDLDWRMNGDTGNNYNDSSHWYGGSTGFLNAIGVSSARVTSVNADEEVSGRAEFYVDSSRGGKKSSICHTTRYLGSHWGYVVNGSWDNTADEVTSITFLTNNSVECELRFYRWVD
jgi:hypothetical protein